MPDKLGDKLKEASIPQSGRRSGNAQRMTIESERSRALRRSEPDWSTGFRVAAAVALALLVGGFLSLTSAGRALSSDLASLVGIGDEPTLDQSKDSNLPASGKSVVVAAGRLPGSSQRYEISAYAADPSSKIHGSKRESGCLNFDLPGLETQKQVEFGLVCVDREQRKTLDFNSASDSLGRLGSAARFDVGGLVSDDVHKVKVSYQTDAGDRVQAPVAFARLTPEIADQTGSPYAFGRFVAFLPDDGLPADGPGVLGHPIFSTVEVTAYDRDGAEIATSSGARFAKVPKGVEKPYG